MIALLRNIFDCLYYKIRVIERIYSNETFVIYLSDDEYSNYYINLFNFLMSQCLIFNILSFIRFFIIIIKETFYM